MFTCDWCISIHFVCFCVSRFTAAACDCPVSGLDQLVLSKFFMIFLILVSCKNKAMCASSPRQKFHSSSRFPSLFLSNLGSFSGQAVRISYCIANQAKMPYIILVNKIYNTRPPLCFWHQSSGCRRNRFGGK